MRTKSEYKLAQVDVKLSGPPRKGDKADEKFDYDGGRFRRRTAASRRVGGEVDGGFL